MIAEVSRIRQQELTLLVQSYEEVRRAVVYLRWHEADADTITPSLYAGRGRKAVAAEAPAPAPSPNPPPQTPALRSACTSERRRHSPNDSVCILERKCIANQHTKLRA